MVTTLAQWQGQTLLLEREWQFTLDELSQACQVDAAQLAELAREGVLGMVAVEGRQADAGDEAGRWRFDGAALRRARLALRLQSELDLSPHGIALVMDLLEQIAQLKQSLARSE